MSQGWERFGSSENKYQQGRREGERKGEGRKGRKENKRGGGPFLPPYLGIHLWDPTKEENVTPSPMYSTGGWAAKGQPASQNWLAVWFRFPLKNVAGKIL